MGGGGGLQKHISNFENLIIIPVFHRQIKTQGLKKRAQFFSSQAGFAFLSMLLLGV